MADAETAQRSWTPRGLSELGDEGERHARKWLRNEVTWRRAHYTLVIAGSILASVAGATALANVWGGTLPGVLALVASALTAVAAGVRPARMASGCSKKAAKYLTVARKARMADEANAPDKREIYYSLLEEYDNIRTEPEPPLPSVG